MPSLVSYFFATCDASRLAKLHCALMNFSAATASRYLTIGGLNMKDVLYFDNMLTPKLITFLYWLLLVVAVVSGFGAWFSGYGGFFQRLITGLGIMIGGALGARIWCELLIVLFKMNEALQDLRSK